MSKQPIDRKERMTDSEYAEYVKQEMKLPKNIGDGEKFKNTKNPNKLAIAKELKRCKAEKKHWEDKIKMSLGTNNMFQVELAEKKALGIKPPASVTEDKKSETPSTAASSSSEQKGYPSLQDLRQKLMQGHVNLAGDWLLLKNSNRDFAKAIEEYGTNLKQAALAVTAANEKFKKVREEAMAAAKKAAAQAAGLTEEDLDRANEESSDDDSEDDEEDDVDEDEIDEEEWAEEELEPMPEIVAKKPKIPPPKEYTDKSGEIKELTDDIESMKNLIAKMKKDLK